ncbi:hypothetical protein C0995_014834 [Termitomyces sp. Mi166|nr:hypothetical protein C0995_014834 [Termitomyces sp. Mi166\
MSDDSKRSDLIDVTYQQLHSVLSGHHEGVHLEQIAQYLEPRKRNFKDLARPFGKPSDASRAVINKGSATLADGVVVKIEEPDKEFIFAVSKNLDIDEVQALVLLRSFLYNEGLPPKAEDASSMVEELVEAIMPFYYSERLFVLRSLIPLLRALEDSEDPIHTIATKFLGELVPDRPAFVKSLIDEYVRKTKQVLPESMSLHPKIASRWAKQNVKEQLVALEVVFWSMWGFVPCSGPLVEKIFEIGYAGQLGQRQENKRLLLDEEGQSSLADCLVLWQLLMIEVLEVERMSDPQQFEISDNPVDKNFYVSSPQSVQKIHDMVMKHQEDSLNVCTTLAWAYILSRLVDKAQEVPESYKTFFDSVGHGPSSRSSQIPKHKELAARCILQESPLFRILSGMLTKSPLFVTAVAWKRGSTVTDTNAIAYRSVLKGLVIALLELVLVEEITDFDALVDVWISLFGRSESRSIAGICAQFWQADWHHGKARRAIFDVARSRFPIHFKPLIRLLRSMTASGFLDYDTLSIAGHSDEGAPIADERLVCASHVFYYLETLQTYTQVVPISACSGAHALYERVEKPNLGVTFFNTRPITLPGGSTLPALSVGRSLSDGGDYAVILWQHEHSGWKVILEFLTDYVNRQRLLSSATGSGAYQDVSFARRGATQTKVIRLEDVGMETDRGDEEETVMHCLDLVRSLVQDNAVQAEQLMQALESGAPVVAHTMTEAQPPDLVQLTTMILEDALSQTNPRTRTQLRPQLITSAMSVLSALLALPNYSNRVWLYIRSTTALFGNERSTGFASGALAAERATGQYTMTLGLLHLIKQLFQEAASSVLPDNPRLQQIKEEVLLRAARFIHTEIWIEHLGWKYTQLGDRFEIGRRVTSLYVKVLEHAPPTLEERPFAALSQAIVDALLYKATSSTINPLVSSISSGNQSLKNLYAARRYGDAQRLIALLESHLHLTWLVLTYKQASVAASKPCLLEQALCARITGGMSVHTSSRTKVDPIDVLTLYVRERDAGTTVPVEAIRVLHALCKSLSVVQPSPPTIIGHLSNPEATVAALVRIVQHPYEDMVLRNAVWTFISLGVDKEPALAGLFVTGKFRTPGQDKGKGKAVEEQDKGGKVAGKETEKTKTTSAIDIARDLLPNWKHIWEINPQLLCSVLKFLDVVWQHGLEHKAALQGIREDKEFWEQISSIACEEVGPMPEYETTEFEVVDGVKRSNLHGVVSSTAYKIAAKSHAVNILGRDIDVHLRLHGNAPSTAKPASFLRIAPRFKSEEELNDLVCEAAPSSYDPKIYDVLLEQLKTNYRGLTLEQLTCQEPLEQREFGDNFAFSVPLLRRRLLAYAKGADSMDDNSDTLVDKQLLSINLNLSLAHSQAALAESWQFLFQKVVPYLRGDALVRPIVLAICATISYDIAKEDRQGDMMTTIHGRRLSLLLSMIELAWFSPTDKPPEVVSFIELVRNVHNIITNDAQSPSKSFLGTVSVPFHRTLLQIMYFCARHCRNLLRRPKAVNAEQRLAVTSLVETSLFLVIDALKLVFESASTRIDPELDRDMELLVAVFEQCTHPDVNPSSALWLARCQEADIIRGSLNLFVHSDLVGLSDLPLLLAKKRPLYAPHLLLFHMALASVPTAAERLASDGVLAAYSNNFISAAISAGMIEVVLPELPNERSPAHRAYCSMLAIVTGIISALGRYNHYFDVEASGFVQLYGEQILRALKWTIGDSITFALLEEIELVVNLFQSIALSAPSSASANSVVDKVLKTFSIHALQLLQQLNYAITHPNHLTSLFEPLTTEERIQFEKDLTMTEPLKRPVIAHLVHRLYRLSGNIITTLIAISHAEAILLGYEDLWPNKDVTVQPHSKVILSEPASIGTLQELGTSTLDLLRELVNRPAGQSLTASTSRQEPLNVREAVLTARKNLEGVLMYAVTQLVTILSHQPDNGPPGAVEEEESMSVDGQRLDGSKAERRAPRASITLGERLRRGMTGEMATDLQSLLNKAKPIIAKSNEVIGKESVDLTQILSNFLLEMVGTPI